MNLTHSSRRLRAVAVPGFLIIASLAACSAAPPATPSPTPGAAPPTFPIARSLSTRQLETIMQRDGALAVSLDEFVSEWNAQANANPELELAIGTIADDGDGRVSYSFFEYLRLEGMVNEDGTLRSVALVDETGFIDPVEIFGTNRADRLAFMPLRAAFARYFFGRAVDPGLTAEAQGRLVEDIIGTDDPEALSSFGKDAVDASRTINGVRYRFASDRSGNLWFIARADDGTGSTDG
jgi:hypothetical protein